MKDQWKKSKTKVEHKVATIHYEGNVNSQKTMRCLSFE